LLAGGGFGGFGLGNFILPPIINTPNGPIVVPPNLVGVPLVNFPNTQTQQNNVYRHKLLTANLTTMIDDYDVHLTFFRSMRTSLTNIGPREDSSTGINLTTSEPITEDITASVRLGYSTDSFSHGNTYNLGLSGNYHMTPTLDAGVRYDFIRRDTALKSAGFTTNAITLTLRKAI